MPILGDNLEEVFWVGLADIFGACLVQALRASLELVLGINLAAVLDDYL